MLPIRATHHIYSEADVKLLGIVFDNKLVFGKHFPTLCRRQNNLVYLKSFLYSNFNYCPFVRHEMNWKLKKCKNALHEFFTVITITTAYLFVCLLPICLPALEAFKTWDMPSNFEVKISNSQMQNVSGIFRLKL